MPTRSPHCTAEKQLLYECIGDTKNPSGQLRFAAQVEVDGLELKQWNPGTKELTKARESLLLSQWTQSQKDPFGSSERSGASVMAGDKLLEPKVAVSVIGSQQDCDSALPKVTSILRAAKVKSAKGAEDRGRSLGASNMEIGQLLSQFPLKSTEMAKVPEEMVLEETRVIKDFLQNSMFSGPGPKEPGGLGPFLLLPPPPPPAPVAKLDKLLEIPAPKKQLPVFAKICSKPEADPAVEEHRLMGERGWERG
ncbi:uncharacterized protein Cadr_000013602 [Camelus dromedarius]|uniref:Uncharacterized protein n=1 Tax=Camelus dromedarius TaxID=9838 RepID=A0A5N4DDL4_CAMDR|nr:uncharacterized protein Cadr_000013602 [Camelus dromedarius]